MAQGFWRLATSTLHNARIGSSNKLLYPYHPLFGKDLEVLGAAGGQRDQVYVQLPDRTTRGIPAWMFDELICAGVRPAEQPIIDSQALLRLADLLDLARADRRSAGHEPTIALSENTASAPSESSTSAPAIGPSKSRRVPPECQPEQVPVPVEGTALDRRFQRPTPKRRSR